MYLANIPLPFASSAQCYWPIYSQGVNVLIFLISCCMQLLTALNPGLGRLCHPVGWSGLYLWSKVSAVL